MAKLGAKLNSSKSTPEVEKKIEVTYSRKDEKSTKGVFGYGSVILEGYPVFVNCALYDGSPEGAKKEYQAFVQYPNRPYQDKEGNTKWFNIAGIPKEEAEARQKVLDVVIHCFEKMDNGEDVGEEYTESGITLKYPKLNPSPKKENILMNFSLNVDLPVKINDLTVRTRPDGTLWTAFPKRPYQDENGETKWAPIAGPANSEVNKAVTDALVEAINAK